MNNPPKAGVLTIFGITGDLAARKLLPSLYHLLEDGLMPEIFSIVGVSRRETSVSRLMDALKNQLIAENTIPDDAVLQKLGKLVSLLQMDMDSPDDYARLRTELDRHEAALGTCLNRLFYLAIPARAFGDIVDLIGAAGLNQGCRNHASQSRILIEKPFGTDITSAKALIQRLSHSFDESQIYRIDHYLAKETAQNILTFRFQNPLFRAVWDAGLIDHITITAAETLGVEGRATFYEQTGALRDLIQSHLLQLLALVTMDEPTEPGAQGIHDEKLKLLRAIRPMLPGEIAANTVRGQYRAYRDETGIADSTIDTFAAIKLSIDSDRWRGVPILLRSGKAMAEKVTEISIVFRQGEHPKVPANALVIRIQPNEGIVLSLLAKKPGFEHQTQRVNMDFSYKSSFHGVHHPDAYERVLSDAFKGDQTLFTTSEEQLATWAIIQPILDSWDIGQPMLNTYDSGSWGPTAADDLAADAGVTWENYSLEPRPIHFPGQ
jgi:glucose-6-phosphate 1-dehydrogenase